MAHRPFEPRQEVIIANETRPELVARFASTDVDADANAVARVVAASPHQVRLETSAVDEALLVLSDTYYPGWRAFVDGQEQPILRGDLLFRVVAVPAGEHVVEFRFEPASVRIGLLVSALALLVVAAVLVLALAGARRFPRRTT